VEDVLRRPGRLPAHVDRPLGLCDRREAKRCGAGGCRAHRPGICAAQRSPVSWIVPCSLAPPSDGGNSWMVVPASFFLFPGTFCGKRFVGAHLFPPRAPGACTRQSPRIDSLVRPKSSRFRDLFAFEIKAGLGQSPLAVVRNDSPLWADWEPAHDDSKAKKRARRRGSPCSRGRASVPPTSIPETYSRAPRRRSSRTIIDPPSPRRRPSSPVVAALLERQSRDGMLSNTADTKPSPNEYATMQRAASPPASSSPTKTSDRRKILP